MKKLVAIAFAVLSLAVAWRLFIYIPDVSYVRGKSGCLTRTHQFEHIYSPSKVNLLRFSLKGKWGFPDIKEGDGTIYKISKSYYDIGSFDGNAYIDIVFRLPNDIEEGEKYILTERHINEQVANITDEGESAILNNGEIVVSKFGNPIPYSLVLDEAEVSILSISKREVTLKLLIKGNFHSFTDDDKRNPILFNHQKEHKMSVTGRSQERHFHWRIWVLNDFLARLIN